jgi:hypothetical protein
MGREEDAGPPPGPIDAWLADLLAAIRPITDGAPASYIPELAKADPALCGIAIATVDGAIHGVGDWREPFTIQSISKAFVYGHVLQTHGREAVLRKVGVEPTGEIGGFHLRGFGHVGHLSRASVPSKFSRRGASATGGKMVVRLSVRRKPVTLCPA